MKERAIYLVRLHGCIRFRSVPDAAVLLPPFLYRFLGVNAVNNALSISNRVLRDENYTHRYPP